MKTRILLTTLMIGAMLGAYTQKPTITITFTGDNNGHSVPLNSILIENLTQGGDTILFAPDTVLVLNYLTAIGEVNDGGSGFSLSQNYPNPMEGKTNISLYLSEKENVLIIVSNRMGRQLIHHEYRLQPGSHSFSFLPGRESMYFLTALTAKQSMTIKMLNSPSNAYAAEICELEYADRHSGSEGHKSGKNLNNFLFAQGDQLQFTASSVLGERTIIDSPTGDQTYTFQFGSGGSPCPGMPIVTDIDGNEYNTIMIGSQCWMKENLKTTTYSNGTAIPNVTGNSEWENLTTGAYAWYDNDISWKDAYGALYNWFATIDANGLCPTGWHVPTHDEWTSLTDFIGGMNAPHGNELKSCRQVNSPLGVGCNTNEHPRWNQHNAHHGTDDYGFSGLPDGYRLSSGLYSFMGDFGYWWTSAEHSSNEGWFRSLFSNQGIVYENFTSKQFGFNVRCLRDNQSAPVSDFSAIPVSGDAPLTVSFSDLSANNPAAWQWNFGDGNTSTQQNPEHIYQNAGSYTVQLTVTNSYGSDTEIKADYITVTQGGGTGIPCPGMPTITDIDGNVYNTVLIGTQCWMKENLKTTTYSNGTPIPNVTDDNDWVNLTSGAYVWFDNDMSWKVSYGALYNWYAAVDPDGICPSGWHVPTNDDWEDLFAYIGGAGPPHGNELKSCRQVNSPVGGDCNTMEHPRWNENSDFWGTDDYGLSGLPGGYRTYSGEFGGVGKYCTWWSFSEYSSVFAWKQVLSYNDGVVYGSYSTKTGGLSIRCLRD
ncbi:MAG: FISUMP domain-containing protein [Bacteroidales bacterium]